jgi:hypothetical protein
MWWSDYILALLVTGTSFYTKETKAETKKMEELSVEDERREPNPLHFGAAQNRNDAGEHYRGKVHKRDKTNRLIGAAMSLLSHLIFVLFTIYITYLSFEDYSLFSWHPACMTIGVSGWCSIFSILRMKVIWRTANSTSIAKRNCTNFKPHTRGMWNNIVFRSC